MRILEVASVYAAPRVGPPEVGSDYRDRFVLGDEGVRAIENADAPGFVLIRGTHKTIVVPFAWQRLGESPAAVEAPAASSAKPAAEARRGRR